MKISEIKDKTLMSYKPYNNSPEATLVALYFKSNKAVIQNLDSQHICGQGSFAEGFEYIQVIV